MSSQSVGLITADYMLDHLAILHARNSRTRKKKTKIMFMPASNLRLIARSPEKEISLAAYFSRNGKKFSLNWGNRLPARPMKTTWELTPGILQQGSLYNGI